jgi:hypothetical protein
LGLWGSELTEDDEGLLGRIRVELLLGVIILVDEVAGICDCATQREVGGSPGPSQGPSKLARLGLGGLVGVGSSEGDATRVLQPHGD